MSTNFAVRLQQQMHGSAFDYLNQQLGIDLVTTIPNVDLSHIKDREGDYPAPWTDPKDLPADIVKCVLPSGRPLVAVRYLHQEKGKERLILEIFFQRYSSQMTPVIRHATPVFDYAIADQSMNDQSVMVSNWVVKNFCNDSIYNKYDISTTFQMIQALADGKPLDKTDGRYLPMYADLYAIKV